MPQTYPQNPLAKLINARLSTLGICRVELIKRLGYANPSRGLRRFDEYLATGQVTTHLLKGLPKVLGLDTALVDGAAAATRQQFADAEEASERERFHPHILVLTKGTVRVPFFVQAFAYGGKVLGLPDDFERLRLAQQVGQAARMVRKHYRKKGGELGTWGTITGYRLQCTFDRAVVLNTDATIREGFRREPEPPAPEIQIKGKRIPIGIFTGE